MTFTVSAKRTSVTGGLTQRPGFLDLRLTAKGDEQELTVYRLAPGYTVKDTTRDFSALIRIAQGSTLRADRTAVKRLMTKVTTVGGVIAPPGTTRSVVVKLTAGTYYVDDNLSSGAERLKKLVVTGAARSDGSGPASKATITMTADKRFRSPATLPRSGAFNVRNTADGPRWYSMRLQQVQPGTTAGQVRDYFAGTSQDASIFGLQAAGSGVLSQGRNVKLSWSLPAGTYALICYFPDPSKPGTLYAGNGMVRIVTLS